MVRSYGLGPAGESSTRPAAGSEVQELTGNRWVPTLVLDDGTVIDGSHEIVDWARAHPVVAV